MTDIIDVNKETQLPVIPSLSEVDAENPKLVSQTLEAIKEAIEVRLGMRGDKLDQSPTWRDLYNNGTIDVILKGTVLSNTSPVTTFPIVGTVKDNIVPPAPAGLTAVGGFENILLLWTMPTYGNHSYTEIYRYDSDDIGQSVLVGTSNGHVFGDNVDIDSSYYYWIRFVSKGAVAGPFNATSGTFAETSASVADLLTDLDETLDATALSTTLRSTINSTFRQTAAPTEKNDGTALVAGDVWYDTDNGNVLKRYNGSAWVLTQDSDIGDAIANASDANDLADSKIRVFYANDEPVESTSNLIDEGDLWIDTDDDANKLHRYDGSAWQPVQDTGIASAIDAASDANDLADSKIRVFYDDDEPENTESNPTDIDTGDLWVDTADANKLYRYDGSNWGSIRDTGIASAIDAATEASDLADSKVRIFHQTTAPADTESNPTDIDTGDLWIDTDDGNKLHRYDGSAWQAARDTGIASALDLADSKVRIFHQTTAPEDTVANPTDIDTGDLWIDTDDGNKLYRYDGSAWQAARDTGIASALDLADSKIRVFYADDAPVESTSNPIDTGDLWIDTDDDANKLHRYDGSTWQPVQDTDIASAIDAATEASDLADSKVRIFHQTAAPAESTSNPIDEGDLWIDTDDGNKLYRYDGSAWQAARDTGIAEALGLADSKIRVFYDAVAPVESSSNPIDEGDLWVDPDYKLWRYDDTNNNWLVTQDNDIGAALETAVGAAATADGKVVIFYQNAQPTGGDLGDLWFDTNDGDKAYKCSGHTVAYNSTYFSIPDGYPYGITKVGAQFYVCGKGGDKVYKFNSSYSNTSSWSLGSPDGDTVSSPSGIAYANGHLYIVDSTRKKVYRYTITGTYKDSFAVYSSVSYPSGICWDGSHFWITDYNNAKVYKHTLGGSYASAYFSCQTSPTDVTWDGSHFWVIHLNQDKLHEYTRDGTATGVSYSVTSHDTYPNGLYADGDKLWVTGHQQDKVRQYVVSSEYELLNLATSADVDTKIIEQVGYCELTASNGDKSVATGLTTKTDCEAATPPSGGSYSWEDSGSIAAEVKTVTSTVGSHTATIQQHTSSINGLNAEYTIKIDSNGKIAGFGLASSSTASEFAINADVFKITNGSSEIVPFFVVTAETSINHGLTVEADGTEHGDTLQSWQQEHHPDGKWFAQGVYFNTAFIGDAAIDSAKIGSINADTIVSGEISSTVIGNNSIQTGHLDTNSVTADKIDIDEKIEFSSTASGIVFGKDSLGDTTPGSFYGRGDNGVSGFHISSSTSGIYADTSGTLTLNNVKVFAGEAGDKTEWTTVGTHTIGLSQSTNYLAIEIIGGGAGSCTNGVPSEQSGSGVGGAAGTASWLKFYTGSNGDGDLIETHTANGGAATAHTVRTNTWDGDGYSGKPSSKSSSAGVGGTEYNHQTTPTGSMLPTAGTYGGGGGGAGANGQKYSRIAAVYVNAENGKTNSQIVTVPSNANSVKVYVGAGGAGGVPGGGASITYASGVPIYGSYSGGYKVCCGAPGGDGYVSISDPYEGGGVEIDLVDLRDRIIALESA